MATPGSLADEIRSARECAGCGNWFTVDVLEHGRCAECRLTETMADLAAQDAGDA